MRTYAIQVEVSHTDGKWSGSRSLPTFYLDGNVQGITSAEHAVSIALPIVSGDGLFASPSIEFHISAVPVD